jgi:hypothetical protein
MSVVAKSQRRVFKVDELKMWFGTFSPVQDHAQANRRTLTGRVEDWRGVPKV